MDRLEDYFYIYFQKIISLFGFSITQSYRGRVLRLYLIGLICLHNIVIQVCEFVTLDLNLRSVAITSHSLLLSICFANVYCTCMIHFSTIQKLFLYINEDSKFLQNEVEREIVRRYDHETKIFFVTCAALCATFIVFISLPPIIHTIISGDKGLSRTDSFPMSSCLDYFLDREIYYYPVYIQQVIFDIVAFSVGITCFSTYFLFIQHICARLSIIEMKIHTPFLCYDCNDNILVEPMELSNWIIDIIRNITRTTTFTKLLNTVTENACLVNVVVGFFLLTVNFVHIFQIPNLLEHDGGKRDACLFIFFVTSILFPIYVNSYIGQRLINRSMDVHRELCVVPIYKLSVKTQKYVLMAILMSEKPFSISIGKFCVTSHELFSNIVRPALSVAMMVNKIQNM